MPGDPLVAGDDVRRARGQMEVAAVGEGEERVPMAIVEHGQRSTAQHGAPSRHEAARDEAIRVHGLAMAIHIIEGGGRGVDAVAQRRWRPPQRRGPRRERISERLRILAAGKRGEETLGVPIAVGSSPTGEQGQPITGVAAEVPGAPQPDRTEEEERQRQHALAWRRCPGKTGVVCRERRFQRGEAARFRSRRQQQEAARPVLPPCSRMVRQGRIFFPRPRRSAPAPGRHGHD